MPIRLLVLLSTLVTVGAFFWIDLVRVQAQTPPETQGLVTNVTGVGAAGGIAKRTTATTLDQREHSNRNIWFRFKSALFQ